MTESLLDDLCLLSQYKEALDAATALHQRKLGAVMHGRQSGVEFEMCRFADILVTECQDAIEKRLKEKLVK